MPAGPIIKAKRTQDEAGEVLDIATRKRLSDDALVQQFEQVDDEGVTTGTTANPTKASIIGSVTTVLTGLSSIAQEATLAAIRDRLPAGLVAGRLDVNVGASALPSGAATEATLVTRATDAVLEAVRDRLPTAFTSGGGVKAGLVDPLPAGANAIGSVSVSSSALPSGASTEAKQDAIITTLGTLATQAALASVLLAVDGAEALLTAIRDRQADGTQVAKILNPSGTPMGDASTPVVVDTELPTPAAAAADATPNPTTTWVLTHLFGFNGATWDRLRSSIANGLVVDVSRSVLPTGAATEATLATRATDAVLQAVRDRLPVAFTAAGGVKTGLPNALAVASDTERFKQRLDIPVALPNGTIYVGYAAQGATDGNPVWAIKRIALDAAGNPATIEWSSTTAIWTNRVTESYS